MSALSMICWCVVGVIVAVIGIKVVINALRKPPPMQHYRGDAQPGRYYTVWICDRCSSRFAQDYFDFTKATDLLCPVCNRKNDGWFRDWIFGWMVARYDEHRQEWIPFKQDPSRTKTNIQDPTGAQEYLLSRIWSCQECGSRWLYSVKKLDSPCPGCASWMSIWSTSMARFDTNSKRWITREEMQQQQDQSEKDE